MHSINEVINVLDSQLDLVMIQELFDESLMLLRKLNCWQAHDINYKVFNKGSVKRQELPEEVEDKLKDLLKYEYELYNFFRRKLTLKIEVLGQKTVRQELKRLQIERVIVKNQCKNNCRNRPYCTMNIPRNIHRNCPCHHFDFCSQCRLFDVLTNIWINHWAHCIQYKEHQRRRPREQFSRKLSTRRHIQRRF